MACRQALGRILCSSRTLDRPSGTLKRYCSHKAYFRRCWIAKIFSLIKSLVPLSSSLTAALTWERLAPSAVNKMAGVMPSSFEAKRSILMPTKELLDLQAFSFLRMRTFAVIYTYRQG